jgi:hypothetical protein
MHILLDFHAVLESKRFEPTSQCFCAQRDIRLRTLQLLSDSIRKQIWMLCILLQSIASKSPNRRPYLRLQVYRMLYRTEYSLVHQRELTEEFCEAASTSIYCWEYAFLRRQDSGTSGYCTSVDVKNHAYLEIALLVANGYGFADVKSWMIILGRKGIMRLSRRGLEVWRVGRDFELVNIYSCRMPCFA